MPAWAWEKRYLALKEDFRVLEENHHNLWEKYLKLKRDTGLKDKIQALEDVVRDLKELDNKRA
jgi:hypothetical protein